MACILIVEDLQENFYVLNKVLENSHILVWASGVSEAMKKFNDEIDLALIDIGLPDGDGFQFCDWVRTEKRDLITPMIFITVRDSVESRVLGFSVGGDDYIQRPFYSIELKARIDAKLRYLTNGPKARLEIANICINFRTFEVALIEEKEKKRLDLTPIEFKILGLLASNPNQVFSRDEILNRIWGENRFIYPRSVDTHISKLRKKLGSKASHIGSVHGEGYRFILVADFDESLEDDLDKIEVADGPYSTLTKNSDLDAFRNQILME